MVIGEWWIARFGLTIHHPPITIHGKLSPLTMHVQIRNK
jgi:hypothetical protein